MSMIETNQQADEQINEAVSAFQQAASGGLNMMAVLSNPTGAMEKFSDPLNQLLQGLQQKNQIVTELLERVESLSCELEALSNG